MTHCKHCGKAIEWNGGRWVVADPWTLLNHCRESSDLRHVPDLDTGGDYVDRIEAVAWKRWPDNTEARNAFMSGALWATTTLLEGL